MNDSPKFSVIIPLYNKRGYIGRAIQSVLAQSWKDYEVVVVDDGSTDGGHSVVTEQFQDSRIRVIVQNNSGEGGARNRGIKEMRGEIAAFLDADDEWLPNHLADIAEMAVRFSEAGWFATGYRSVFRGGFVTDTTILSGSPVLIPNYFETATGAHFVHISSIAARRATLDCTGGFLVGEPVGADLEFCGRLALRHTLAYHPAVSGFYYHHIPQSAMSVGQWRGIRPPVVRTLEADETIPPALRQSVHRYSRWVLSQYVLAGLCAGHGRKALDLFDNTQAAGRLLMALSAPIVPSPALNFVVRLLRSRWFSRKVRRRGQVLVRRVSPKNVNE